MAIAWALRDQGSASPVTTALIGASRAEQIVDCVGALKNLAFSPEELAEIDKFASDAGINLWAQSAELD